MDLSPTPKITKRQVKIQHILITYDSQFQNVILDAFEEINKKYAVVHLFREFNPQSIEECRNKILLSKRAIKFLFIFQLKAGLTLTWDKWFHYGKQGVFFEKSPTQTIKMDDKTSADQIIEKSTKKLHLDFIWLGVGCRLGTKLPQFVEVIQKQEPFQAWKNTFIINFFTIFNQKLQKVQPDCDEETILQLLQECEEESTPKIQQISDEIEDLVCQCYNQRILITGLTFHNFYRLLKTRNYFKLIWIQQSTNKRYKQFMVQASESGLKSLERWVLRIQNFLFIDDYFYEKHQQKVGYEADFIINRVNNKDTYASVIERNYKEIFRKFRPDFDEYFLSICQILKTRSGCIKEAVGSVIVKNKRILSTGYNGTPINSINCYNGGCRVCNNSSKIQTIVLSCNCIHAQYSCIIQAGIEATPGCTLYTTQLPCLWCCKVIIQAKLSTVVYVRTQSEALRHKNDTQVYATFKKAGVKVKEFEPRQGRFSRD